MKRTNAAPTLKALQVGATRLRRPSAISSPNTLPTSLEIFSCSLRPHTMGTTTDSPTLFASSIQTFFQSPTGWVRKQPRFGAIFRSEEHTSELQSRLHLVFRLLLLKKILK